MDKRTKISRLYFKLRQRLGERTPFPKSSIPKRFLRRLQVRVARYKFDGVVTLKNPFDLALYAMLISELKPATIIEVGSANGGSAKWFAAIARGLHLRTHVYSFDINPLIGSDEDHVSFHFADIYNLAESELPKILETAPRPFLVVEDGPHVFEACLASLRFFDNFLEPGDYMVTEDGNVRDLGTRTYRAYHNGPNRAIEAFLRGDKAPYEIDRTYCDFFGTNVTWNTNGYLKKINP